MTRINEITAIRIGVASPEEIRRWSHGEVTKPETINYRTLRAERDGLFCERIFGPTKDWECACGKYKRVRHHGIICDKCGVEVTRSRVRRERMGHIELAAPITHIWFVKGTPSRLGLLLNVTLRNLERVIYFAAYIVTDVDEDRRASLLERIEKQVSEEIAQVEAETGEQIERLREQLAGELGVLDRALEATLERFEEELLEQTETFVQAAKEIEAELEAWKGGPAHRTLVFEPTGEVIVQEGETVTADNLVELTHVVQAAIETVEPIGRQKQSDARMQTEAERDQRSYVAEQESARLEESAQEQIDQIRQEADRRQRMVKELYRSMLLTEAQYREYREACGNIFRADMGAGAVRDILGRLDLNLLSVELKEEMETSTSAQRRKKAGKRLRVVESFRKSGNRPEWMIMTVLPVLPPDLRPMVQLDGGRFATSDLNDLYRRVINRNNRLRRLLELKAPEIIIRNEKRMLQEAVDALIDNGRRGRAVSGRGKHRLKSLSDMLKGKQGRFRQNLLGKRVDYSGRSVIVVGPNLKLHQCGLPKRMALELFKPFVMRGLVARGYAHNIKSAKRSVERIRPEVWDVLEEVVQNYLVLLNRAPSLHRLSIQAFEPVLIEGSAIQLHPLVCTAFAADFDGDQMAVHVPLSERAQQEARNRMLSVHNLLSPATGSPIITPSQEMVLGCYYMTLVRPGAWGEGKAFSSLEEALMAYDAGLIGLQTKIRILLPPSYQIGNELLETCLGRVILNEVLPEGLRFRNEIMDKKALRRIIAECYRQYGAEETAAMADRIKQLGFRFATRAGLTIGIEDIEIPEGKTELLSKADSEVENLERQFRRGLITEGERYRGTVEVWTEATQKITSEVSNTLDRFGPVYMMATSGARGNIEQIRQMAGMRGLMTDPAGRIIDLPIRSNFREGLSVLEYFVSTHGGRKGLADTALRTAEAGYLTRRLVDVAQDVTIVSEDCETEGGIWVREADHTIEELSARLIGRRMALPVADPSSGEILVDRNDEFDEQAWERVDQINQKVWQQVAKILDRPLPLLRPERRKAILRGDEEVPAEARRLLEEEALTNFFVRSPLSCQAPIGLCSLCYGRNLATGNLVGIGEAIGIIAAQSIGEPGTQLTLRTFHTGGVKSELDITKGLPRVQEVFEARLPKGKAEIADIDGTVEIIREGDHRIIRVVHSEAYSDVYEIPEQFVCRVEEGDEVEEGDLLAETNVEDDDRPSIVASVAGQVFMEDGRIVLRGAEEEVREYEVPIPVRLRVREEQWIEAGHRLTEGSIDPRALLQIAGREAVQSYLVNEAQSVYCSQGVDINDKHLEIIIRQMLRRVQVDDPGDTDFLPGDLVDRSSYQEENSRVIAAGGEPATAHLVLLGITKAALNTDSWLAAASFQETTRVLTEAAVMGKMDYLRGLKENVIIGRLIPAGTGLEIRRKRAEERQRLARIALEEEGSRSLEREQAMRFLRGDDLEESDSPEFESLPWDSLKPAAEEDS
ncbi:MAG: DNA-directed RNA polymerase subunit beta' [Chloroflexia bacterium]|nr:DNA-directed RNA polymerase subunit beta' [Chloroflexia bacterium]